MREAFHFPDARRWEGVDQGLWVPTAQAAVSAISRASSLRGARVVPSKNPFLPFCPFYKRKWVIPNVTPFPSVQIMII
jgi:hypothetical protein